MAVKKTREQQHDYENIPPEIWLEIRSRLPIKDLFKYQCVAKSWNPIPLFIYRKNAIQPLSGLILRDTTYVLEPDGNTRITYLSKGATESISIRTEIAIYKPVAVSSGFDTGYLRDTFFEFGPLSSLYKGEFFTVGNGLILTSHKDGTYHVFNPFTKQVLHLPKSPLMDGVDVFHLQEKCAFLINPFPYPDYACSVFQVLRIIPRARTAEIFYSKTCRWICYDLMADADDVDEVLNSSWCSENFFYFCKTTTLFLLTEKEQGLAVRFEEEKVEGGMFCNAWVYNLPLPQVVKGGFRKARLGGDTEYVYLSYYDNDGEVWFWMCNGVYNYTWVVVLKIGTTPKLSRWLERLHNPLFKLMKGRDPIIPVGFHPLYAIAFLRVNSTIFAYNLREKKLEKFAEFSDQDFNLSTIVLSYSPLVAPFKVSGEFGSLKPMTVAEHFDMIKEMPC